MVNITKSLAYLTATAALALASCSGPGAQSPSAAVPQHRFNVYFDVAKSDLTPEAQQVIGQVIAEAHRDGNAKVLVVMPEGDRKARRDTVQAALLAGGISPDRIDARWIGTQESPAPGVRDPRNRVVEISFEHDLKSGGGDVASVFLSKRTSD
jgi:outer membrane protein OmpA-like peptidoglycan-associated protein